MTTLLDIARSKSNDWQREIVRLFIEPPRDWAPPEPVPDCGRRNHTWGTDWDDGIVCSTCDKEFSVYLAEVDA